LLEQRGKRKVTMLNEAPTLLHRIRAKGEQSTRIEQRLELE